MDLTKFYDELKAKLDDDRPKHHPNMMKVTSGGSPSMSHPGAIRWKSIASKECEKLKDNCRKHIILDIYCNIIPLDDDYVKGHKQLMKNDIDSMLASKGMTPTQYLTSAYKETKAPLLEFVLRATDMIGREFLEEADKTLKDAQEKDIEVPAPQAPDVEDQKMQDELVGIQKDDEYKSFIQKLKEKTVNKIVNDISKIINDKKEEKEITFDPKPIVDQQLATESTVSIALNYLNQKLMTESVNSETQEEMIGMAIRESTLNQMDVVFNQPASSIREYSSRINFGRGIVINESALSYLTETNKRYESLYKEVDGEKYDVANYEKIGQDGTKTPMNDREAKKVLGAEEYKAYQNRGKK